MPDLASAKMPDFLKPFLKKAKDWLKSDCVRDIEFSQETYQILVQDFFTQKECWTFFQFQSNQIRDCFCACEEDAESHHLHGCIHLAVAWLRIFNGYRQPIHQRFQKGLWYCLCYLYCERLGADAHNLKKEDQGIYRFCSVSGKQLLWLKAKTAACEQYLSSIFFDRPLASEETSIKFSNLSHEELHQWRLGHPSQELIFELSFWSDLAKWMFFQQEEKDNYTLSFLDEPDQIPHRLFVSFEELEAEFYISTANWPEIVPALEQMRSPLKVVDNRLENIEKIIYDPQAIELKVIARPHPHLRLLKHKGQESILDIGGGWTFIPKKGFFASDLHHLLENPVIKGEAIGQLFSEQTQLLKQFLEDFPIYEKPIPVSYRLEFDKDWNLHIYTYVFEKGDLNEGQSALLGKWAYLDEQGFFQLENVQFPTAHEVIPSFQVATFVQSHRSWINQFPGFQLHLSRIEDALAYTVDEQGKLSFFYREEAHSLEYQHDFINLIYIQGSGFYPKLWGEQVRSVRAGITIGKEQVPLFIEMHKEDLQLIPKFFTFDDPLVSVGLKILVEPIDQELGVIIHPTYVFKERYQGIQSVFFDKFIYLSGEGFYEMTSSQRLPEIYHQENVLKGEELQDFLTYQLSEALAKAIKVDPRLLQPKNLDLSISRFENKKTHKLLHVIEFVSEIGRVKALDIWEALHRNQRFLITGAGLIHVQDERFSWLYALHRERFDVEGHLSLSAFELIRLNAFDKTVKVSADRSRSGNFLNSLLDFKDTPLPHFKFLRSQLRPYQNIGVQWLWHLWQNDLSGLLCDDMGLGKTHQTMALIDVIYQHTPGASFIVVCPTSVLFHWQEKLEMFLPGIPVHVFYGNMRSLKYFNESKGILLTSYGIFRNEVEKLSITSFDLAILDEIQVAKNHQSRIYRALIRLQARMRLGLTGTPLENHLRELKALFDLVLPSYLPSDHDFREYFIKPIEKEEDTTRRELLARLIKPFILRRKKEEVLTELPPKTEEIAHCALLASQRHLYNEVLNLQRSHIESLKSTTEVISYIHIFSVLSSLKQICNHPACYLKRPQDYQQYSSGKWNLFVELLREAQQSHQKVVVFSHYLAMLDIFALYLTEQEIQFASLRGSTRDRAQQIHNFQHNPECQVFLGSLQAAGTGIDLTAASVVIHYDRWWNAAKENQATDRVHRIGQSRGVQVFKLVTKDTFEERIDELIERKGSLTDHIISSDEANFIKKLDRYELLDLLQTVEMEKGIASIQTVSDYE